MGTTTGIQTMDNPAMQEDISYDLQGRRVSSSSTRGIHIVRMADGTVRKVK